MTSVAVGSWVAVVVGADVLVGSAVAVEIAASVIGSDAALNLESASNPPRPQTANTQIPRAAMMSSCCFVIGEVVQRDDLATRYECCPPDFARFAHG